MFAVIKTGGKQYRVAVGDVLSVEKLTAEAGETVTFDSVLMHGGDGGTTVGAPLVDGAVVTGQIIEQYRDKKIVVFKKRRRKHSSKTRKGHRQYLTRVRISGIPGDEDGTKAAAAKPAPISESEGDVLPHAENAEVGATAPADGVPSGAYSKPANLVSGEVTDGDDLEKLPGLGKASEEVLNRIGVHYYTQFTEWNSDDWDYIEAYIEENVKGTITVSRPSIVTQAQKLIETREAASKED